MRKLAKVRISAALLTLDVALALIANVYSPSISLPGTAALLVIRAPLR
jgi:hypothetical protein